MTQDERRGERDRDPDQEATSGRGAASRQAAEAGGKEQAEGGQTEAQPAEVTQEDRDAARSGPSGTASRGLEEWEEQVVKAGPERPEVPREGDTRQEPPPAP